MGKKFYGIYRGASRGVYEKWETVRMLTSGVPNSRFKSFPTREEAQFFVDNGHPPTTEELKKYATIFHQTQNMRLTDEVVVFAEPSKKRVTFWNRVINAPDGVEWIKTLKYPGNPYATPAWVAEIKAVAEQLLIWTSCTPKMLTKEVETLSIGVTEIHAFNVLNDYMYKWKENGWKDSKKHDVQCREVLKLIMEEMNNVILPCPVSFPLRPKPSRETRNLIPIEI